MRHPGLPLRLTVAAITVCALLLAGSAADGKQLSIYSTVANYSLPVVDREGHEYVGLLEVLDPLGNVSSQSQGQRWTIQYDGALTEFTAGSKSARVQGHDFEMASEFLLENGRGLVPVASLGGLLQRILGGPVTLHEDSRRVFIGSVAIHFTAQAVKSDPPSLVMNFSSPVNPMISTEPGKLRMVFNRDALVAPGSKSLSFDSKIIPSATFDEQNGTAEIAIDSNAPLFASFSSGRRTITISAAQATASTSAAPSSTGAQAAQPQATAPASSDSSAGVAATPSATRLIQYFVVVDPSHGGSERGAALTDQISEKDVNLALARRLRLALEAQGLSTLVLRDGDNTLTLDQRASLANRAHPAIYLAIHTSSQGHGVRIYTAMVPAGGESTGPFINWETAQSLFVTRSQTLSSGLLSELGRQRFPARALSAPLRPLNSIMAAAVAVEVAPPPGGIADLNSVAYQDLVGKALATAVSSLRGKLEAGR